MAIIIKAFEGGEGVAHAADLDVAPLASLRSAHRPRQRRDAEPAAVRRQDERRRRRGAGLGPRSRADLAPAPRHEVADARRVAEDDGVVRLRGRRRRRRRGFAGREKQPQSGALGTANPQLAS